MNMDFSDKSPADGLAFDDSNSEFSGIDDYYPPESPPNQKKDKIVENSFPIK